MQEHEQDNFRFDFSPADDGRVNGEYRFSKSGMRENIYADARYVPAGENTVPPRYYTPPVQPERPKSVRKGGFSAAGAVALALCCALLGGIVGAVLSARHVDRRLEAMESQLSRQEGDLRSLEEKSQTQTFLPTTPVLSERSEDRALTPADIYNMACHQVVGVTTEVTYTNYFGMKSSSAVTGTGFAVSEDGYILTNYHVISYAVEGNNQAQVILRDGTRCPARVVGYEEYNDLAVLRIDRSDLTPVSFGDSDTLQVGDEVFAVGNPLGELDFSMTTGRVSALGRLVSSNENPVPINMFQLDAAVNTGNSGGPVYNARGEVVGIVTAKYSSAGVEGLGFAIPINDAVSIAGDLIQQGYVSGRAHLGVNIDRRYNAMYSRYYGLPLGAYVHTVDSGSCAAAAGIRPGDILLALGEAEITDADTLDAAVHGFAAGESTTVRLYRSGDILTLTLTFDEAKG